MILWPPAPHDPRERDHVMMIGEWEARLFGERMYEYFRDRGLWHMQLWHRRLRISVLTPSRLTRGRWEAFPIRGWRQDAPSYGALAETIEDEHPVAMPDEAEVQRVERALVHELLGVSTQNAS